MLTVREYNINAKQREFAGHTGRVFDVDINHDGLCVTASRTARPRSGAWRTTPRGPISAVRIKGRGATRRWAPPIADAAGASLLAIAGADSFCNLWRGGGWSARSHCNGSTGGDQVYGTPGRRAATPTGLGCSRAGAAVRTWGVNAGRSTSVVLSRTAWRQSLCLRRQPAPRGADATCDDDGAPCPTARRASAACV